MSESEIHGDGRQRRGTHAVPEEPPDQTKHGVVDYRERTTEERPLSLYVESLMRELREASGNVPCRRGSLGPSAGGTSR